MRHAIPALVVALAGIGCNVVQLQQAGIVGSLREHGMETRHAELGEAEVRYLHRAGEGTPVLLVHGFGGSALWQWYRLVPALDRRPLVAPDLLWFGGSTSRVADHSLDQQVRAMVALLDRLGYERVDVVGISYGGLVAYELAASHPDRVRRLVVVDSPGREYTRQDYRALCDRFGVDHIGEILIPEDERGVRTLLGLAYADPPWLPDFALWQTLDLLYGAHRVEQLALLDAMLRDLDLLRARPDPIAETLLIWGRDDPVFPLAIGRRLASRLDARLAIIDRARHAPNLEHPAIFNALVAEFLRDR